jgi:teichuronic acid biosynthesis glycosyltransferase TuaH
VMTKIAHPMKKIFSNCTEFAEREQPHADFRMPPLFPKPTGTVYIGFVGMISADRVDIDLLHSLFTRFTSFQFIFVGSTNKPSLLARLKTYSNFRFVPEVPHTDLAPIIHSFDAAIVPHLDNDSTRGADLPTVLDYLACSVPVVSTATLNVESYGNALYMAKSMWEFGNLLERVVSGDITHNPAPGREIARVRSWSQSVPELMDWLFQRLPAAS